MFPIKPCFELRPTLSECPQCGNSLTVCKTIPKRQIATLHLGSFEARVVELSCRQCGLVQRSESLASIVPPGANFGYDVIEFVGRGMFCEHRSAESLMTELNARRIGISESAVRDLASRFVAYLALAHEQATPRIAAHLQGNGGYILHLDSTSRGCSSKLLVGVDPISNFVLLSVKLQRETGDEIATFMATIFERYGIPLGIVADMAAAIRCARLKVAETVPLFVCHFHFLRDAGCDLMKAEYQQLRRLLKASDVEKQIRTLSERLEPAANAHAEAIESALFTIDAQADLPVDALDPDALLVVLLMCAQAPANAGDGLGFPFDRVWVNYAETLLQIRDIIHVLDKHLTMPPKARRHYTSALRILDNLHAQKSFHELLDVLRRRSDEFDKLRVAFHLAEPTETSGYATVETSHRRDEVKPRVQAIRDRLDGQDEYRKLVEQLDRHWDGLFREAIELIDADGGVRWLHPARTNNVMEHLFGTVARDSHHRTGVAFNARNSDAMLPALPMVRNLADADYMALVLDGAGSLAECFSGIEAKAVRDYLAEHRNRGLFSQPQKARKILLKPRTSLRMASFALTCEIERLASATA